MRGVVGRGGPRRCLLHPAGAEGCDVRGHHGVAVVVPCGLPGGCAVAGVSLPARGRSPAGAGRRVLLLVLLRVLVRGAHCGIGDRVEHGVTEEVVVAGDGGLARRRRGPTEGAGAGVVIRGGSWHEFRDCGLRDGAPGCVLRDCRRETLRRGNGHGRSPGLRPGGIRCAGRRHGCPPGCRYSFPHVGRHRGERDRADVGGAGGEGQRGRCGLGCRDGDAQGAEAGNRAFGPRRHLRPAELVVARAVAVAHGQVAAHDDAGAVLEHLDEQEVGGGGEPAAGEDVEGRSEARVVRERVERVEREFGGGRCREHEQAGPVREHGPAAGRGRHVGQVVHGVIPLAASLRGISACRRVPRCRRRCGLGERGRRRR